MIINKNNFPGMFLDQDIRKIEPTDTKWNATHAQLLN